MTTMEPITSDPAVQAAQRARMDGRSNHVQRVAAAREALKPIRELHKPVETYAKDGSIGCDHCWDCRNDINEPWPCDTAKLIYSAEELAASQPNA